MVYLAVCLFALCLLAAFVYPNTVTGTLCGLFLVVLAFIVMVRSCA